MARQVPQRNKLQLILLIVFCILFVISTALAILGLVNYDKVSQDFEDLQARNRDLDKKSSNFESDASDMVRLITGKNGTVDDAKQAAAMAYQATDEKGGLAPELLLLAEKYNNNRKLVNDLNLRITGLDKQLAQEKENVANMVAQRQQDEKAFKAKEAELNNNLIESQKKLDEIMADANKNVTATRKSMAKTIAAQTRQIERLTIDNQNKTDELDKLKKRLDELKMDSGGGKLESDGRIAKLARKDKVCYINKGSSDKVSRGMTFAVYSSADIGKTDVKEKGKIRVTKPSSTFSECVIVDEQADNPIMMDDIISSPAYHNARPQVFIVAGDFDLHNTGRATSADADEVKNAIRRSGGKVVSDITVQTDYVVLGEQPQKPTPPADDALPATQTTYQEQLKRYDEYIALEKQARNIGIPILNTNRFLSLTGYKPDQLAE